MTGYASVNFSDSDLGLFTPADVRRLMKIEHDRAVRYDYPLAALLIKVDRLDYLHDLYGVESKEEVLRSILALLRAVTRSSDFLGCMEDERVLVLFPHTAPQAAAAIAGRLVRGARKLEFESGGKELRTTLSIGVVVASSAREVLYASFEQAAQDALALAVAAGGDRFVHKESASTVIEELRADIAEEERALAAEHRRAAEGTASIASLPDTFLADQVREIFRAHGDRAPEILRLRDELVRAANAGVETAKKKAAAEITLDHEQKVELLERRVSKLKELLDQAEAELQDLAARQRIDPGVASIYRSVQGLSPEEHDLARKKEMLLLLFEANVELRSELDRERGRP